LAQDEDLCLARGAAVEHRAQCEHNSSQKREHCALLYHTCGTPSRGQGFDQGQEAGRYYAIANLRTLESGGELGMVQPMDYSCEGVSERRTRRASRWTPVRNPM
jgi:hypothetical protein